jgi:acylphosphatase
MEKASAKVIVKGMVQGVGYRAFAYYLAQSFKLDGFVKNLPNGNVGIEVEGNKEDILEFIERLKTDSPGYVEEVKIDWDQYRGKFSGFHIGF